MASYAFGVPLPHAKEGPTGLIPRQETQKSEVANLLSGLGNSPHKVLNFGQPSEGKESNFEDREKRQLATLLSTLKSVTDGISLGGEDQQTGNSTGGSGLTER